MYNNDIELFYTLNLRFITNTLIDRKSYMC